MHLKREPTSMAALLTNVIDVYQMVAEEKRITITACLDSPCTAAVDPVRMRQVFANLLDNALKYTPEGGTVTVACRVEQTRVLVQFSDTGTGISTEEQPRIWARLYRGDKSRSQHGLGLGLSLVKAIVEAHQGTVSVQSGIGAGSAFTVELPITSS
jgi:signal transduction histidine kinase